MREELKKLIFGVLLCGIVTVTGISTDTLAATPAAHVVTFMYGAKVFQEPVFHGQDAIAPVDTAVPGFIFLGWAGNLKQVTEDRMIVGQYQPAPVTTVTTITAAPVAVQPSRSTYEVVFIDGKTGERYYHQTVSAGASADAPAVPSHNGYHFTHYDGSFTNVTSDRTITACYEKDRDYDKVVEVYVYPEDDYQEIVYVDDDVYIVYDDDDDYFIVD